MSGVTVPGPLSAVDYGKELPSPGEPMAPDRASVRGAWVNRNRSAARPCHIDSSSTLRLFYDTEGHCLAISYALLDLLRIVPRDRCIVSEDVFTSVVVIDEVVFILHVKPFHGPDHSFIRHYI